MLQIKITNQFKKDLKLAKKRNYDMNLLKYVVDELVEQRQLADKFKNHMLTGNYKRIL